MKKATYLLTLLAIVVSISACKKTDSTTPSPTTPANNNTNGTVSVNSTPQFTGTINGVNYSLVTGSVYSGGTSVNKLVGGTNNTAGYESYMNNTSSGQPFLGINKGTLQLGSSNFADTASFDAFFNTGTYSYSINYANGIEIDWIDASGNSYTTSLGTGSQTGSTFTITGKHVEGIVYGTYEVQVMAKFSCKLYNSSGGSVTLTNGVYVGDFGND